MVRSGAARAHPSLHAQPPARRDRAGQRRRLHALPLQVAARRSGRSPERPRRAARSAGDARRLRAGGRRVGAERSCRRASTATIRRCSTCSASRARSGGRGCRSPPAGRSIRRGSRRRRRSRCSSASTRTRGSRFATRPAREARLTDNAPPHRDMLRTRGASFFSDLAARTGLDATRRATRSGRSSPRARGVRRILGSARAARRATSGAPAARSTRQLRRAVDAIAAAAGRGCAESAVEAQARALLRRYGVVFRRLLARESAAAPWRRAGAGLPAARSAGRDSRRPVRVGHVGRTVRAAARGRAAARSAPDARRRPRSSTISTADPLNLAGIVTAGERIRAAARNRLVYRDGVAIAVAGRPCVPAARAARSALATDAAIRAQAPQRSRATPASIRASVLAPRSRRRRRLGCGRLRRPAAVCRGTARGIERCALALAALAGANFGDPLRQRHLELRLRPRRSSRNPAPSRAAAAARAPARCRADSSSSWGERT